MFPANPNQLKIIRQLQTELKIKIPQEDKIDWDTVGYQTDENGNIIGLGLYGSGVKTEHLEIINNLTNLTILNLDNNQITEIKNLENLTNLTELYLSDNQITDTTPIKNLILNQKGVVGGPVLEVSSSTGWKYGKVTLGGNPLKTPPMRVVKKGNRAFLKWFKDNPTIKIKKVIKLSGVYKDALGSKKLAEYCSQILDNMDPRIETMFGVFGEWGRGKTFFIKQILEELKNNTDSPRHQYIRVNYHAWKYQNTPANWAYLYQVLLEEYLKSDSKPFLSKKINQQIKIFNLNLARNNPNINFFAKKFYQSIHFLFILPLWSKILLFILFAGIFFSVDAFWFDLTDFFNQNWQNLAIWYNQNLQANIIHIFNWFKNRPLIGVLAGLSFSTFVLVSPVLDFLKTFFIDTKNRLQILDTAQNLIKKYGEAKTFQDKLGVQAEIDKEIEILLKHWIPVDEIEIETQRAELQKDIDRLKKQRNEKPKLGLLQQILFEISQIFKNEYRKLKKLEQQKADLEKKYIPYKKIVLFIDDLDRCNEEGLIELIDSLRIMLEQKAIQARLQVLVAVDERLLSLAIRHKYSKMKLDQEKFTQGMEDLSYQSLALEYMDKLFLLGVKLPNLKDENREKYYTIMTEEDQRLINEKKQEKAKQEEQKNPENKEKDIIKQDLERNKKMIEIGKKKDIQKPSQTNSIPPEENKTRADKDNLTQNEIKSLKEVSKKMSQIKPNLTPRQQLVFFFRFQLLRRILIDEGFDWYKADSEGNIKKEATDLAIYSLWLATVKKREWGIVKNHKIQKPKQENQIEEETTEEKAEKLKIKVQELETKIQKDLESLEQNKEKIAEIKKDLQESLEIVVPY